MRIIEAVPPDALVDAFRAAYGVAPTSTVRSPYRICPLGAHIDHQLGPVSAFATEHAIQLAFRPASTDDFRIRSLTYPGEIRFDRSQLARADDWADYARAAVQVLTTDHDVHTGLHVLIHGELAEAGLSSSAAVGLAYLTALADLNDLTLSPAELVELDRRIENDYMGLRNGILDPGAIAWAQPDMLTLIDCATLDVSHHARHAALADTRFLAVFSGLREPLVRSSRFNSRVEECTEASVALAHHANLANRDVTRLGEIPHAAYEAHVDAIPAHLARRARHFFGESARVRAAVTAWEAGHVATLGNLMNASAASSIANYETGTEEIIALVRAIQAAPGVHGGRFCGAGFRGCCVGFVDVDAIPDALDAIEATYRRDAPQFADQMWAIITEPAPALALH